MVINYEQYVKESVDYKDLWNSINQPEKEDECDMVDSWNLVKHDFTKYENSPCLRLRVKARLHSGYVILIENEDDKTYEIIAITTQGNIKGVVNDVKKDDLIKTINGLIERESDIDDDLYKILKARHNAKINGGIDANNLSINGGVTGALKTNLDRFAHYDRPHMKGDW